MKRCNKAEVFPVDCDGVRMTFVEDLWLLCIWRIERGTVHKKTKLGPTKRKLHNSKLHMNCDFEGTSNNALKARRKFPRLVVSFSVG